MGYLSRHGAAGLGNVGTPPGGTTWESTTYPFGYRVVSNGFRKTLWDYWSTSGWSVIPEQATPEQMAGGIVGIGLLTKTGQSMPKIVGGEFKNVVVLLDATAPSMQPTRMAVVGDVVTAAKLVASGWYVLDGEGFLAAKIGIYMRDGVLTSQEPLKPGQQQETFYVNKDGSDLVPWSNLTSFTAYRVPAEQTPPPPPVTASMGGETPKWVIPVAIGAGVLVLGGLVYAATRK